MSRTWRLLNLTLETGYSDADLRQRALCAAGVDEEGLVGLRVARRSLDARRSGGRRRLRYVLHVDLTLDREPRGRVFRAARRDGRLIPAPPEERLELGAVPPAGDDTPAVVVGAGPAGILAAYVLALHGRAVALLDRGKRLDERGTDVVRFHRTRCPNPESNLLFGEGGAGTYSDGKLYSRVGDALEGACLDLLIACGAQPEIRFDSRAHIGTDRLHRVLPRLRERLTEMGVEFHWGTRLTGVRMDGDARRVTAVETSAGEMRCAALFLAPGHSARDTIAELHAAGLAVEPKPFQLGVRIEHPQELIDRARHGVGPEAAALGPAYYNLVCAAGEGCAASHSFCMCPGGKIVASVNESGLLCTNGMSNSMHSSPWANAALVTTFGPDEFGRGAFDGVAFQRELEARFFTAGGADYTAPAQTAEDFLAGRETRRPRHSSYTFGTSPGRIDRLLPERARAAIARALVRFERSIPGFAGADGLLVGLESRSSGPLRIPRDRHRQLARGTDNLYPIGEGAGYAGGIMSAAIDGARAAQRFLAS